MAAVRGTGCGLDGSLVWSSTSSGCPVNHFLAPRGTGVVRGTSVTEGCLPANSQAGLRCCADDFVPSIVPPSPSQPEPYANKTTPCAEGRVGARPGTGGKCGGATVVTTVTNIITPSSSSTTSDAPTTVNGFISTSTSSSASTQKGVTTTIVQPEAHISAKTCSDLQLAPSNSIPSICAFSKIGKDCHVKTPVSHSTAEEFCSAEGGRLCTVSELSQDVAVGSGCKSGSATYVWTSDACGSNPNFRQVAVSASRHLADKPPLCTATENSAGMVRCCADVSGNSASNEESVNEAADANECDCLDTWSPVCSGGRTYINPCRAFCAYVYQFLPGSCEGEIRVGRLQTEINRCEEDSPIKHFDDPLSNRRLKNSAGNTRSSWKTVSADLCATKCHEDAKCESFEWHTEKYWCELKGISVAQQGHRNANNWLLYERKLFCLHP
jgi:hypothetical protein